MLYDKNYIDTFCIIDKKRGIKIHNIDKDKKIVNLMFNLFDGAEDEKTPYLTILYPLEYSVYIENSEDLDEMEWYEDFYFMFRNLPKTIGEDEEYLSYIHSELESLYPSNHYRITKDNNGKLLYSNIPTNWIEDKITKHNMSLEDACDECLQGIRECLDEGLDDEEEYDD